MSNTAKNKPSTLEKRMEQGREEIRKVDYYKILDLSIEQANKGQTIAMKKDESVEEFLNRLVCTQ